MFDIFALISSNLKKYRHSSGYCAMLILIETLYPKRDVYLILLTPVQGAKYVLKRFSIICLVSFHLILISTFFKMPVISRFAYYSCTYLGFGKSKLYPVNCTSKLWFYRISMPMFLVNDAMHQFIQQPRQEYNIILARNLVSETIVLWFLYVNLVSDFCSNKKWISEN